MIYLPADVEGDLDRVEAWQAERDLSRDEIVQWLRAQSVSELPDDLSERIRSITKLPVQHVSAARMAGLAWYWHDGHADQAPELYAKLGAWRKTDAEAWERMAHVRRRAQNRRLTFYRQTASRWCQKFRLIILRDLDLKAMVDVKDEKTGEHNELGAKARAGRYVAALSELTQALMNAASREHTNLIRVTAGTVEKCSVCGFDILELREHVVATCTNCGEQLERRTNASANLRRYADENRDEITAKVGEALNEANRMLSKRSENKAKRTSARIESARIKREEKAARAGSERAP